MMHLRGLVVFVLFLRSAARRSTRTDDFHHDTRELLAGAREASLPAGVRTVRVPRQDLQARALRAADRQGPRRVFPNGQPDFMRYRGGASFSPYDPWDLHTKSALSKEPVGGKYAAGVREEVVQAKWAVEYAKEPQRRINFEIAALELEKKNILVALDKTPSFRPDKRLKLMNALEELNEELSVKEKLARKAGEHSADTMLDYAKEARGRIKSKIASFTMEQAKTQAELDKTPMLRLDKRWKLQNALKQLNEELVILRKLARTADEADEQARLEEKSPGYKASELLGEKDFALQEIKKLGVAGVAFYALWEGGFWNVSGILRSSDKSIRISPRRIQAVTFVSFARLAIPLRLALSSASQPRFAIPWGYDEDVVRRKLFLNQTGKDIDWDSFAEKCKVVDEAADAIVSLNNVKELVELFNDTPLKTGSGVEVEMVYKKGDSGETSIFSNWSFELQEDDLSDDKVVVELKKILDFPVKVTGKSTFNLNSEGKVQQMNVGSWSINGQVITNFASVGNVTEVLVSDEGGLKQGSKDPVS